MKSIISILFLSVLVIGVPIEETINIKSHQKDETLPDALKNYNFLKDNNISESRIVGGIEAIPHEFPYTVGLSIFTQLGTMNWCGGSLIAENYVLTAAHCLKKAYYVIVYIGCHEITDKNCVKIKTEKIHYILHEKFQSTTLQNDIALIKLPGAILMNENIQLIKLPETSSTERISAGESVTAIGWGYYHDGHSELSDYLRYVNVKIMDISECRKIYLGIPRKTNICIDGSEGKSTCNGDSGGPLVYTDKNYEKILVGLSSYGAKAGCEIGWPAVFTRITSYLDWIMSEMSS